MTLRKLSKTTQRPVNGRVLKQTVYVSDKTTKRFDSNLLKSIASETVKKEEKKDRFFTVSTNNLQANDRINLPTSLQTKVNQINQNENNIRLTPAGVLISSGDIAALRELYPPIEVKETEIDPEEVNPTTDGWEVIDESTVRVPSEGLPKFEGKNSLILRPEERPYIVAIIEENVNNQNPKSINIVIRKVKSNRFIVKNYFLLRKSILTQLDFDQGKELQESSELLEKYKIILTKNFNFNLKDLLIANVNVDKDKIYAYKILVNYEQKIVQDKVELINNVDEDSLTPPSDSLKLQVKTLGPEKNVRVANFERTNIERPASNKPAGPSGGTRKKSGKSTTRRTRR